MGSWWPGRTRRLTRTDRRYSPGLRMEAIKKKMQAMKVEKDNLCDRCDEVEQKAKEAHIRQEKAEEECTELTNKARTWRSRRPSMPLPFRSTTRQPLRRTIATA